MTTSQGLTEETSEFLNILRATLPAKEVCFFSNIDRLSTILRLVDKYAENTNVKILDLGCGAFVLDFLLERKGYSDIIAIDKDQKFPELYRELRSRGLLTHTHHIRSDMTTMSLPTGSRNLVILNDALFYPDVDLARLLPKVTVILQMGGYFIFDVWRSEFHDRFGIVYDRIYAKYKLFKRYSQSELSNILDMNGFRIKEIVPWFSTNANTIVQKILWLGLHVANDTYFVAKKEN